jgi:hypothetical protein
MKTLADHAKDLATEFPDAEYNRLGCKYTVGKSGPGEGCIVGQAMLRWKPELLDELKKVDTGGDFGVYTMLARLKIVVPDNELRFLSSLQVNQDRGVSWGKSLSITKQSKDSL